MFEFLEVTKGKDSSRSSLNRKDAKQVTALLALQVATYAIPLTLVPYLGRTLGPDSFGRLAIAQSFGAYITVAVQYGFNYSGTRSVAQVLGDSAALAIRVRDIMGAKLVLMGACLLLCSMMLMLKVDLSLGPKMFWSAFLWGVVNGYTLVWFFQGSRQLVVCAYLDCAGRVLAIAGIFLLVHQPSDAHLVLLLQGMGAGVALLLQLYIMYGRVRFRWPSFSASLQTLSKDFHVFASRCVESVYLTGTSLILGTVQPVAQVGLFAGPEKLVRAASYGIFPFYQVAYPRLVSELGRDKTHALRYARNTIFIAVGTAIVATLLFWFNAKTIVRIALGPQFIDSAIILKLMAPLVILMVAVGGVGSNLMLALNRDKWLTKILTVAGGFCALATYVLSRQFGAKGSCVSLLATYAVILMMIWYHFYRWPATDEKRMNGHDS